MRQRCTNPNNVKYPIYGGRGITVCERWLNSYANFVADMSERPEGMTLDRKNNNGNYEPGNCRWANSSTQNQNKRNRHDLTVGSKTQSIAEWCRELGLNRNTVHSRLNYGWPSERVLGI